LPPPEWEESAGARLRRLECLHLRVKDVDFGYRQIRVRQGKGGKDRVTVPPLSIEARLQEHLVRVKHFSATISMSPSSRKQ